nr:hypothetical protein [Tanacetum cinerariifolium]
MKLFLMQLGVLTKELGKSWQNLWSQQQQLVYNLLFWNAEWNKHGRFSEMEGLDYFKKSLDLFKDVGQGLKGTLEAKGIKPVNAQFNPQKTHTLVEIKTALQNINGGFSCTVRCVPSKLDNRPQIQEIRHGNDSGLGMLGYFNKTLELFNRDVLGLKAKLELNGIKPSNSTIYNLTDIEAAVINITHGFNATITCVKRNDKSNKQQIQEIRFNYTKNFEMANNLSPSKCDPQILFAAGSPPPTPLIEVVSVPEVHHDHL